MGGRSHTKYDRQVFPTEVEVVRRHHPLIGQRFPVIRAGKAFLVFHLGDGSHLKIPTCWTSAGYDPSDDPLLQDAVFTTASISALLDLIQNLSRR
jgi:hypothetical protein